MDDFEFRQLSLGNADQVAHELFVQEFVSNGEKIIPGSADRGGRSYPDWLDLVKKHDLGEGLTLNRVPSSLYFFIRKKEHKILGAIDIRHKLNEDLLDVGGNIGYGVTPSERRRGYASLMLKLALEKCRELGMERVLITCDKGNLASAKTIKKQGGILENELDSEGSIVQRYWIDLTEEKK